MSRPLIFDIQRYCLHDGNGVRTTIFFKGCPLSCLWCHNPEGISYNRQLLFYAERCRHCEHCASCGKPCTACGKCVEGCKGAAREIAGKSYTVSELVKICKRDKPYYKASNGGVTLSGGEVMSQDIGFITELTAALNAEGIEVLIDTSGCAPFEAFISVAPLAKGFLYDVKCIDSKLHERLCGVGNERILQNLVRLNSMGSDIELRVPVIVGANDADLMNAPKTLFELGVRGKRVKLLAYHSMGTGKAQRLGQTQVRFETPDVGRLTKLQNEFMRYGYDCEY